jgi:hypothetical protein
MGPTGERQEAARFRWAREGPSKTLVKSDKFAWSKFEQPIGWPAGRKPWMVFVKAQEIGGIRVAFSLATFFWRSKRK